MLIAYLFSYPPGPPTPPISSPLVMSHVRKEISFNFGRSRSSRNPHVQTFRIHNGIHEEMSKDTLGLRRRWWFNKEIIDHVQ